METPLRHGDVALIVYQITPQVASQPAVARYNDEDQHERDRGVDPEYLSGPYWTFFGTEWTANEDDQVTVVKRLRLVDEAGKPVTP